MNVIDQAKAALQSLEQSVSNLDKDRENAACLRKYLEWELADVRAAYTALRTENLDLRKQLAEADVLRANIKTLQKVERELRIENVKLVEDLIGPEPIQGL